MNFCDKMSEIPSGGLVTTDEHEASGATTSMHQSRAHYKTNPTPSSVPSSQARNTNEGEPSQKIRFRGSSLERSPPTIIPLERREKRNLRTQTP